MSFAVKKFVVIQTIYFSSVARNGIHYPSTKDHRTTEQGAILVPVSAEVLDHIGFSTFISIVDET